MIRLLFLCTGNSCRSQMAEGWTKALKPDAIDASSAGIVARGLDPRAVAVMAEAGVDISGQRSKRLDDLDRVDFDWVVTVCGDAHENCPVFSGSTRVVHVGFDDPPRIVDQIDDEVRALEPYRRVRDEIRRFIESLPGALPEGGSRP